MLTLKRAAMLAIAPALIYADEAAEVDAAGDAKPEDKGEDAAGRILFKDVR
jgi:hypothetical protein